MFWIVFNKFALVAGYIFIAILFICVICSLCYWTKRLYDKLIVFFKTHSYKIEHGNYVYKISYKYLKYDHTLVFGDWYDWFYIIERHPIDKNNRKYVEYFKMHYDAYDTIYFFEKPEGNEGRNVVRYDNFEHAKDRLNKYINELSK